MSLRIRFLDGPRSGEVLPDLDRDEISIGRDPAACQVVLPADDRRVGRIHCELKHEAGRYRLVLNRDHRVYVNEEEAADGQELDARTELRIGKDGPRLLAEAVGGAALQSTLDQGGRRDGQATLIRRLVRSGRRVRVAIAAFIVAIPLLGWLLYRQNYTQNEMAKAQIIKEMQARSEQFTKALNEAAQSVYLVAFRDKNGNVRPSGTAWVVGPATLATNAHVAEDFYQLPEGARMVVRSPGSQPQDHVVRAVSIHPGYAEFSGLLARECPLTSRDDSTDEAATKLEFIGACDVAILSVDVSDHPLSQPLELADEEELEKLQAGDPVGSVGYPMENLVDPVNLRDPVPVRQRGSILAWTDVFSGQSRELERQLLKHSVPAAGGASGSPILDSNGHVIALLNAGNAAFVLNGLLQTKRLPSAAMINFGQRVDLLRELLDGDAEEKQRDRSERWAEYVKRYRSCRPTAEDFWRLAQLEARESMASQWPVLLSEKTVPLVGSKGQPGSSAVTRLDLDRESPSFIVAYSSDAAFSMRLKSGTGNGDGEPVEDDSETTQGEGDEEEELSWHGELLVESGSGDDPIEIWSPQKRGSVTIRVYGTGEVSGQEVVAELLKEFAATVSPAEAVLVLKKAGKLSKKMGDGYVLRVPAKIEKGDNVFVVATAEKHEDIDLAVFDPTPGASEQKVDEAEWELITGNDGPDWYPNATFSAETSDIVVIVAGPDPGVEVTLNIYAAKTANRTGPGAD